MRIDKITYDRIWRAVEGMSPLEATDFVMSQGLRPPTDAPGWEIAMERASGRDGEERLVWVRLETVVIDPVP